MVQGEEPGQEGIRGAEAAPEPFAASEGQPTSDAEAGSGVPAAVACVLAAALAFVLPILAVQLMHGDPPVVEDFPRTAQMQSVGRPAAVRPAYRVHIVPDVHFPRNQRAPLCEP